MERDKHATQQPGDQLTAEQVAEFLARGQEMVEQLQGLLEKLELFRVAVDREGRLQPLVEPRRRRARFDPETLETIAQLPYLRVGEAAILARKSRNTIYQALYSGELDFIESGKRYLIPRDALDDWVERGAPSGR